MIVVLFMLVNNRETLLTKWGDNSLVIFVLHPLFFFIIRMYTLEFADWNIFVKLAFVIFISIVACSSLVAVSGYIRWLLYPLESLLKLQQSREKEMLEEEA